MSWEQVTGGNSEENPDSAAIQQASAPDLRRWLDLFPVAWLLLVLAGFAGLAFFPLAPVSVRVPAVEQAERGVTALLVSLLVAAAIRFLTNRR